MSARTKALSPSQMIDVRLPYEKPYDFSRMLAFFRDRTLVGTESIDECSYSRAVGIESCEGGIFKGIIRIRDDRLNSSLVLEMTRSLEPVSDEVGARARKMFDTEGDPSSIQKAIFPLKRHGIDPLDPSIRLPGCFDPFETACRAILGQQVSVKAASKFAERIAAKFGESIFEDIDDSSKEALDAKVGQDQRDLENDGAPMQNHPHLLWPSAERICGIDDIEGAFGELGVVSQRSRAIFDIASMIESGELDLSGEGDPVLQMEKLLSVKGVGPWSANYIAMRALGHKDAFLETDVGVAHALPSMSPKERVEAVKDCRPLRSYAIIALWNSI